MKIKKKNLQIKSPGNFWMFTYDFLLDTLRK